MLFAERLRASVFAFSAFNYSSVRGSILQQHDAFDYGGIGNQLAVGIRFVFRIFHDRIHDLHARDHAAEGGVLIVERKGVI